MALQPKIVACGKGMTVLSLAMRFIVGPAVMAGTSAAIGIRGVPLQVAIVQVFNLHLNFEVNSFQFDPILQNEAYIYKCIKLSL